MFTESESVTEPTTEQIETQPAAVKKTRRKPRQRVRVEKPEPTNQVKVNASFSVPVEQLAHFANDQYEDEDDEEIEETEEIDPNANRNLLFGAGLAPVPFRSPMVDSAHSDHVRDHLRQVSEANAFKAKIWQVPESFAVRNPLIQRKPTSAPGWAMRGEIQYDPETLETDLLALFADGYYFVEIRESGQFRSGQLVTVGDPSSSKMAMPPTVQPTVIHEAAPVADPVKEATAQAKILDVVLSATTRLLEAQATQQPAPPKQPSLKDRMEELQMLQSMFAPKQPQQQQRDPMEKLAEALESEAFKKVLSTIKSDNPAQTQPEGGGFWDFAMGAVEMLAPGLNPLLAGLGKMLMTSGATESPNPAPKHAQQAANPISSVPSVEPQAVEEDEGVDIRFLIQDLADNTPPEQTAQKIKDLMAKKPFAGPFLKQYLAMENQAIWDALAGLAENETEAAGLRQALEACNWREDWLNSLKQHLKS